MILIWSGSGAGVAFVSAALGVGAMFLCTWLGLGAGKAIGIGGMAAGAIAWMLGKHDSRAHPCAIFFIPLRVFAVVTAAAGGLMFITPDKPKTPEDDRMSEIVKRLGEAQATGNNGRAQEAAARYAALKEAEFGSPDRRCHVVFDSPEAAAVRKVELYVKDSKLKTLGDEGKKALCAAFLKRLKAEFPQATCHVAIRGMLLWGVRGSSSGAITADSQEPRF